MTSPVAATIDANGISAPDFPTILAYLVQQYQSIFGADAYLGNDSQDGQFIGVIAQAIADCNSAAVSVYNAFSPATAQGNGLSSVVKINGLQRLIAGYSTAPVTCVGTANTPINNGQVTDGNNNYWALPASVTIPSSGTITVTATCTTVGAITVAAGAATIATPTYGWQTATFSGGTSEGAAVETDAALRVRQEESTALPAETIFEGIVAAIKDVPSVTRVAQYENNTNATDSNGIPAGTLCFVVEGGAASAIQAAIASRIPPGTPTYGTTTGTIVDANGSSRAINFYIATPATIGIALTLIPGNGWASSTEPIIAQALADYVNALEPGANVSYFDMVAPALLPGTPYAGTFSVSGLSLTKNGGATQTSDVTIAFNEAPVSTTAGVSFSIA